MVKPMSYKALLAIAAALDLEIEQMDVKTAFLYGYIDHEIYVEQPHHMADGTRRVCKLRKALYGLKQAPRIWYQTLTNFLRTLGFEPINADLGIFVWSGVYIAVYVDDLLIIGPSIAEIKNIKRSLRNRFQMTDLGPCSYYLGMSIRRDRERDPLSESRSLHPQGPPSISNERLHTRHYSNRHFTSARKRTKLRLPGESENRISAYRGISDVYHAGNQRRYCIRRLNGESVPVQSGTATCEACSANSPVPQGHKDSSTHLQGPTSNAKWLHRCRLGWLS